MSKDKVKIEDNGYINRVKRYFILSNPIRLFDSEDAAKEAKEIASGKSKKKNITDDEKERAKIINEASFNPITGEKLPFVGKLAAQVPIKMLTLGGILAYYETVPQIIFWQWLHQTVTSYIDYKTKKSDVPASEIGCAYSAATLGAVATALALTKQLKCSSPLVKRMVPLASLTVGNLINVPSIRNRDLSNGIVVSNDKDAPVGISKAAGMDSVIKTALNRTLLIAPALVLTPTLLNHLEKKNTFCKKPWLEAATAVAATGIILALTMPFVLAAFAGKNKVSINKLEGNIKDNKAAKDQKYLYYNNENI